MDGLDGSKGHLGDHGEDCRFCPDGKSIEMEINYKFKEFSSVFDNGNHENKKKYYFFDNLS